MRSPSSAALLLYAGFDLGGIESSRYLEPLCMVWVKHGLRAGSWNHAFKLLQK